MKEKIKHIVALIFFLTLMICINLNGSNKVMASVSGTDSSILREKVSKAYTKKFCNSIGFGLSKESAMIFSIEENNKVFKSKKGIDNINKVLLAEEIATSVVEKCGYPINLSGEKGIQEFKRVIIFQKIMKL